MIATATRTTPPGPSRNLSLSEVRSEPLDFLNAMTARYGNIVRYQTEGWTTTLLNRPDYVKRVLQDNWTNYTKQGTPDFMLLRPMLGEGLLTTEGETWKWQRRMAQPAFHGRQIAQLATQMTDLTTAMLDDWERLNFSNIPIEMDAAMSALTLRIVARTLFGYVVAGDADEFGLAVEMLNECTGHPNPNDPQVAKRFHGALSTVHRIVNEIILVRRFTGEQSNDLLAMLMAARDETSGKGMSVRQLRDQVLTLLLAGHETTAKALAWTLYLLDQHPDVADKLQQEVDSVLAWRVPTVADTEQMPYTWMVLQESMRYRTPIWLVSRRAVADDEIDGFTIEADSLVAISPFLMHRHADYWEFPNTFYPEHFAPAAVAERPTTAYLPFSAGPRLCIGKPFASLEMRLVLPMILQRFRPKLLPDHPVAMEALVTLRPHQGLPMTIEAR